MIEHVLGVARELSEKKQLIKLDRLFNICRQELAGVTSQLILDSIDQLVREKRIRPRSKLVRKGLLENSLRQEIYTLIVRNPGISISKIRKLSSRGTKIVLWHLEVLQDFDCIFEVRFERKVTFFPAYFNKEPVWTDKALEICFLFQDKKARALLTTLLGQDSVSTQTFQETLAWPRQTIQYQIAKLEDRGIVDKFTEGGMNFYFLLADKANLIRRVYDHLGNYDFRNPSYN